MIVTVDYLKSLEACTDQVALFEATFGESVEVTRESLTRAVGAGLDLDWFGRNAFGEAYNEAKAPARNLYGEVTAGAWKAYKEATAEAWKAYIEVRVPPYDEAKDLAWKAYNEATAPASKDYKEAIAPAWKAYQEALIEVIFNLSQVTSTP